LLSVPVQVIAWRTVSEMNYNVSSGTLNLTHSLTLKYLSHQEKSRVVINYRWMAMVARISTPPFTSWLYLSTLITSKSISLIISEQQLIVKSAVTSGVEN